MAAAPTKDETVGNKITMSTVASIAGTLLIGIPFSGDYNGPLGSNEAALVRGAVARAWAVAKEVEDTWKPY